VHGDDQVDEGVSAELAALLLGAVDDRPVKISSCVCGDCAGRVFSLRFDDVEGGAERECSGCGAQAFIADSAEYWEEADPCVLECPCGSEEFEVAVAFTLSADGSVRWVTVGARCPEDGAPGVCADWKINYIPTDHLLSMV
jgi:hypothetical protein